MDGQGNHGGQSPSTPSLAATRSSPGVIPQHRRFDESWVEVSSQPSSSSLSSIGDEIVTTGLQVGGPGRRRRLPASARSLPQQTTIVAGQGSGSQDEYDESESEEDQVLTSSAENMHGLSEHAAEDSDAESDDGDNATALGRVSDQPVFRPQPNAFSHPPSHLSQRSNSSNAAIPSNPHSDFTRPSFSHRSQTRVHRGGPAFMSAAAREDNDAALRASLTTLLSCAAAARRLPKSKEEMESRQQGSDGVGPSDQPMELRLVPESELMDEPVDSPRGAARHPKGSPVRSSPRAASRSKSERSTSANRSPRATKRKKTTAAAAADDTTLISPTLLTWVFSAGVVVLVSVVGFGAGYVIGREVGRQEILSASVGGMNETSSCGREAIRNSGSLRRLKWGVVGRSILAQA